MFRKIENQRPFQGILDQITENVRAGKLKPGEALPAERMMAEQLGVSRPVVREALRALELLGIITSVRGGA
ncbi:MAG: FadR/GntR family transcriptional regulator, partial [Blautia sp.]